MQRIRTIALGETDSTNSYLKGYAGPEGRWMTVVTAESQTAGRGQGANAWESERGKNLLFSVRLHPTEVPVERQFVLLEAQSLALRDTLAGMVPEVTIKWPNDIYCMDMKMGGTLAECTVNGRRMGTCILGTGLNVNQRSFSGDAPNPVSLFQILGKETPREPLLERILERLCHYLGMLEKGRLDEVHALYQEGLYRREGLHRYEDARGGFLASLHGVRPCGHLVLRRADGTLSEYSIGEVRHVIGRD